MRESAAAGGERAQWTRLDAVFVAAVVAVAAVVLAQSWHGWLDPIIDTGRDLYIPEQLRHGAKLYRDIAYYYPPLTPYLLALITAVTGSSIAAYTAIGIAIAALTAGALYFAGRVTGGPLVAFSAALLFAACSIAGRSTWGTNYLFPYAHAATLATLFFAAFLGFLCAHLFRRSSAASLAAALLFALAASWTKIEFALFTTVVLAIAFVVHRIALRWLAAYVAAGACSVGIASLVFRDAAAGRHWLFDNVAPSTLLGSPYLHSFYREVTGVAHWPELLGRSVVGALVLAAVVVLIALAERSESGSRRLLLLLVACGAAILLLFDDRFFRAWTVLQIALVPFAIRRPRDPLTILLAASLCTTSRVFFNIVPVWYGFVFLVPLYLLASYVFFELLPAYGVVSRRASMFLLAIVAAISLQSIGSAHLTYGRKVHAIETPRGRIFDSVAGRAELVTEFQRFASQNRIRSLVVMPEGLALNYLTETPTPVAYYTFTPPEAADPAAEAKILREFEDKRPEWIAFVPRNVTEFGAKAWGVDYDQQLAAYIRASYVPAARFTRPGFWMVVARRR